MPEPIKSNSIRSMRVHAVNSTTNLVMSPSSQLGFVPEHDVSNMEKGEEPRILRFDETGGSRFLRRSWVAFSYISTFLIPSFLLSLFGIKGQGKQIAWREKTALCIIFFIISAIFLWWVEVFPLLFCRTTTRAIDMDTLVKSNELILINGNVLNITRLNSIQDPVLKVEGSKMVGYLRKYVGKDASKSFPRVAFLGRQKDSIYYDLPELQAVIPDRTTADNFVSNYIYYNNLTAIDGVLGNCPVPISPKNFTGQAPAYSECFFTGNQEKVTVELREKEFQWYPGDVYQKGSSRGFDRFSINDRVYDFTDFMKVARVIVYPGIVDDHTESEMVYIRKENLVFPEDVTLKMINAVGTDATETFKTLDANYLKAFDRLFYIGKLAKSSPVYCSIIQPTLLGLAVFVYLIILGKFIFSLNFGMTPVPTYQKDYAILFVPCYTEGTQSLKKTIDSLARFDYDDKRKLLFVVCDGNLTGSGNAKSTPRLVLDILGYNSVEPEPYKYESLGTGEKSQNRAKVYCGYYHVNNHIVPYLVVVKVGNVLEKERPGNRGKRDSQLILMNFLNKILDSNGLLTPLEHEMFFCINTILEVNPKVYEFVLMVDADTEVEEGSLNALIAKMSFDSRTIGLCGETQVQNKFTSFTTFIQVYEYYISHHLGKSFESLFGSVTCLPGCFSLYRIKSQANKPFLADQRLIADYSVNTVETLHLKNLLHLGEDRYLTTLMLKYFPRNHLKFIPNAKCWTIIPDTFSVLLSQRRRWINSTIHNLFELLLVRNLCGWFIFSMKTVIVMDLIGTILMPASLLYFYYTVIKAIIFGFTEFAIVIASFFSIYILHLFIFLTKREWQYMFWLLVYVVFSLPVFCIILPLYSFWHFDDFSWGKTRRIQSEGGDDGHGASKLDTELMLAPVPKATLSKYMEEDPRYENAQLRAKPSFNSHIVTEKKKGLNLSIQRSASKRSMLDDSEKPAPSPLFFSAKRYAEPDASPLTIRNSKSFMDSPK